MNKKRLLLILSVNLLLLLIPLLAMQCSENVNWKAGDFLLAAILLVIAGLAFELTIRWVKKTGYRIFIIVFILLFLFLIWAELAVGLIEKLLT